MKTKLTLSLLLLGLTAATAQEKLSEEQLGKIAPKLYEAQQKLKDLQFKVGLAAEKCDGLKASDVAVVVALDRDLTPEKLEKADKNLIPLGHLYLKGLSPAKKGKPTENDRMHILMIDDKGTTHRVWLCLLGAQKRDGKLELVLFGSEKKPLFSVALKKHEGSSKSPVEISGEKGDDKDSAELTIDVLGQYRAEVILKKLEV